MATFPSTPIIGTNTIDDPRSEHISMNETFTSPISVPNGGGDHEGRPSLKQITSTCVLEHVCYEDNRPASFIQSACFGYSLIKLKHFVDTIYKPVQCYFAYAPASVSKLIETAI